VFLAGCIVAIVTLYAVAAEGDKRIKPPEITLIFIVVD